MPVDITIRTILHSEQSYETVGNWGFTGENPETLSVSVSQLGNWRYEALVGVHELVEALLCKARGVDQHAVTTFDEAYEKRRPKDDDDSEPGDDPAAPYHHEHVFATQIEKLLCAQFGIDWAEYDKAVNALSRPSP